MLHSLCQDHLSQERRILWANKVLSLQKLEAVSEETEAEAAVASEEEVVEHQEVVVDLEVDQAEEVEEEAPQEEEGEAIEPNYLRSFDNLKPL